MMPLDPDTLSSNLAIRPKLEHDRVAFCGASGTGKTTMATWLAEEASLPLNPVGSRSVAKEMGFDSPYDVDKAGRRGEFQRRLVTDKRIWENLHPSFVTDRTTLDNLVYTMLHDVRSIDAQLLGSMVEGMKRYTLIVVCPVDVHCKLGTDTARIADLTYQQLFDAALEGVLDRWAPTAPILWLHHEGVEVRKQVLRRRLGLETERAALWVDQAEQCEDSSPDNRHSCTVRRGHDGAHVAIDPMFDSVLGAWAVGEGKP